jgi:hypothetical protein
MRILRSVFGALCALAWAPSSHALDCAPSIRAGDFLAEFFADMENSPYAIGDGFIENVHRHRCGKREDTMRLNGAIFNTAPCDALAVFGGDLMRNGTYIQWIEFQPVIISYRSPLWKVPRIENPDEGQIFLFMAVDGKPLELMLSGLCEPPSLPQDAQSATIIRDCLKNRGCTPEQTRILNENSKW